MKALLGTAKNTKTAASVVGTQKIDHLRRILLSLGAGAEHHGPAAAE